MPKFSKQSLKQLETCDPRLQVICTKALETGVIDFSVLEGHRGEEAQKTAYLTGASKARWGESKHNSKPSMAVDLAPYPIDWGNKDRFILLAGVIKTIASQYGVKLTWGGDWEMLDMPHFEIEG